MRTWDSNSNSGVNLSLCWDGETPTAELRINGIVLTGRGIDVERAFHELTALQRRVWDAEGRLEVVRTFIERIEREVAR